MQVSAERVKKETIKVNVNPVDVIEKLRLQWHLNIGVGSSDYINSNGFWEDWTDTGHGSGLTRVGRQATPEEKQMIASFQSMRELAENYEGF